jgi:Flp pilus assembly pilin Flp
MFLQAGTLVWPAPKPRRPTLLQAIELKALEVYNRIRDFARSEHGQTTAEYVAVTAVAVALALAVLFAVLGDALNDAVSTIASRIESFAADTTGPPDQDGG